MEYENTNEKGQTASDTIVPLFQEDESSDLGKFIKESNAEILKNFKDYLNEKNYVNIFDLYCKTIKAKNTEHSTWKWKLISIEICIAYLDLKILFPGSYFPSVEKVLASGHMIERSLIDKIGAEISIFFDRHVLQDYVLSRRHVSIGVTGKLESKVYIHIMSVHIISHYASQNEIMIKSSSETDYLHMSSKKKNNPEEAKFYSEIDVKFILSKNVSKSLSQINKLHDDIKVCVVSGKYKMLLSASERMICKDFISQSADLLCSLDKSSKKKNFGIWMEIQSHWMDEDKNLGYYRSILQIQKNIFELRRRKTFFAENNTSHSKDNIYSFNEEYSSDSCE